MGAAASLISSAAFSRSSGEGFDMLGRDYRCERREHYHAIAAPVSPLRYGLELACELRRAHRFPAVGERRLGVTAEVAGRVFAGELDQRPERGHELADSLVDDQPAAFGGSRWPAEIGLENPPVEGVFGGGLHGEVGEVP